MMMCRKGDSWLVDSKIDGMKSYLILSLSWGVYFPLLLILFGAVGVPVTVLSPNQLFSASAVAYAFWHMLLDERILWFSPAESWNVWLRPRSTLAVYLSSTTWRKRVPWKSVFCYFSWLVISWPQIRQMLSSVKVDKARRFDRLIFWMEVMDAWEGFFTPSDGLITSAQFRDAEITSSCSSPILVWSVVDCCFLRSLVLRACILFLSRL